MAWSVIWTIVVLIVFDGQKVFSRIERPSGATGLSTKISTTNHTSLKAISAETRDEEPLRDRLAAKQNATHPGYHRMSGAKDTSRYAWQSFPISPLLERMDWVLDLMMNFRGMGWNWRIPTLPEPPKDVIEQLSNNDHKGDKVHSRPKWACIHSTKESLLRASFQEFLIGYALMDILKTLIIHDQYFMGYTDSPAPSYLPELIRSHPVFIRSYRLMLALLAICYALETIFQLGPLFFVGILGGNLIGVRGEHWMYPKAWGSYRAVFDRGLAGWWGEWWHQTFRFGFETISKHTVQLLGLNSRSLLAKTLQLLIAFSLSGFLHASASHTSIGDTRPLRGPFLFFFLQPFGIMAQILIRRVLKYAGISQRLPQSLRQLSNFMFVHIWFYHTAPLFVDDLVKGGQFLYEPIPISLLRFIGFGVEGDSWYCWHGRWLRWHSGKYWWESGIIT
jgi:hypothetical protein